MKLFEWMEKLWACTPGGKYDIWKEAFDRAVAERLRHGCSTEYWRIWYEEVCPAYRKLSGRTPTCLRHPQTDQILEDMDKPVSQRTYF